MEYFKFWVLFVVLITTLATAEKVRPYEFGYIIEGQQHRYEKRDENGVITGDFGFVTGDGVYHATQFAADETGKFRITATRTVKIGLPGQPGSIPIPRDLFLRADYYKFREIKPSDMATCSNCAVPEMPKSVPKDAKPIVTMTVKQKEDNVQRVMTLEVLRLPTPTRKDPNPADVKKKEFVPIVHPPNAINPVHLYKPLSKKTNEPSVKVQPTPATGRSPVAKPKALPTPDTGTGKPTQPLIPGGAPESKIFKLKVEPQTPPKPPTPTQQTSREGKTLDLGAPLVVPTKESPILFIKPVGIPQGSARKIQDTPKGLQTPTQKQYTQGPNQITQVSVTSDQAKAPPKTIGSKDAAPGSKPGIVIATESPVNTLKVSSEVDVGKVETLPEHVPTPETVETHTPVDLPLNGSLPSVVDEFEVEVSGKESLAPTPAPKTHKPALVVSPVRSPVSSLPTPPSFTSSKKDGTVVPQVPPYLEHPIPENPVFLNSKDTSVPTTRGPKMPSVLPGPTSDTDSASKQYPKPKPDTPSLTVPVKTTTLSGLPMSQSAGLPPQRQYFEEDRGKTSLENGDITTITPSTGTAALPKPDITKTPATKEGVIQKQDSVHDTTPPKSDTLGPKGSPAPPDTLGPKGSPAPPDTLGPKGSPAPPDTLGPKGSPAPPDTLGPKGSPAPPRTIRPSVPPTAPSVDVPRQQLDLKAGRLPGDQKGSLPITGPALVTKLDSGHLATPSKPDTPISTVPTITATPSAPDTDSASKQYPKPKPDTPSLTVPVKTTTLAGLPISQSTGLPPQRQHSKEDRGKTSLDNGGITTKTPTTGTARVPKPDITEVKGSLVPTTASVPSGLPVSQVNLHQELPSEKNRGEGDQKPSLEFDSSTDETPATKEGVIQKQDSVHAATPPKPDTLGPRGSPTPPDTLGPKGSPVPPRTVKPSVLPTAQSVDVPRQQLDLKAGRLPGDKKSSLPITSPALVTKLDSEHLATPSKPDTLDLKGSPAPPDTLGPKGSPAPPDTLGPKGSPAPPDTLGPKGSPAPPDTLGPKGSPALPDTFGLKESAAPPDTLGLKGSPAPPDTLGLKGSPAPPRTIRPSVSPTAKSVDTTRQQLDLEPDRLQGILKGSLPITDPALVTKPDSGHLAAPSKPDTPISTVPTITATPSVLQPNKTDWHSEKNETESGEKTGLGYDKSGGKIGVFKPEPPRKPATPVSTESFVPMRTPTPSVSPTARVNLHQQFHLEKNIVEEGQTTSLENERGRDVLSTTEAGDTLETDAVHSTTPPKGLPVPSKPTRPSVLPTSQSGDFVDTQRQHGDQKTGLPATGSDSASKYDAEPTKPDELGSTTPLKTTTPSVLPISQRTGAPHQQPHKEIDRVREDQRTGQRYGAPQTGTPSSRGPPGSMTTVEKTPSVSRQPLPSSKSKTEGSEKTSLEYDRRSDEIPSTDVGVLFKQNALHPTTPPKGLPIPSKKTRPLVLPTNQSGDIIHIQGQHGDQKTGLPAPGLDKASKHGALLPPAPTKPDELGSTTPLKTAPHQQRHKENDGVREDQRTGRRYGPPKPDTPSSRGPPGLTTTVEKTPSVSSQPLPSSKDRTEGSEKTSLEYDRRRDEIPATEVGVILKQDAVHPTIPPKGLPIPSKPTRPLVLPTSQSGGIIDIQGQHGDQKTGLPAPGSDNAFKHGAVLPPAPTKPDELGSTTPLKTTTPSVSPISQSKGAPYQEPHTDRVREDQRTGQRYGAPKPDTPGSKGSPDSAVEKTPSVSRQPLPSSKDKTEGSQKTSLEYDRRGDEIPSTDIGVELKQNAVHSTATTPTKHGTLKSEGSPVPSRTTTPSFSPSSQVSPQLPLPLAKGRIEGDHKTSLEHDRGSDKSLPIDTGGVLKQEVVPPSTPPKVGATPSDLPAIKSAGVPHQPTHSEADTVKGDQKISLGYDKAPVGGTADQELHSKKYGVKEDRKTNQGLDKTIEKVPTTSIDGTLKQDGVYPKVSIRPDTLSSVPTKPATGGVRVTTSFQQRFDIDIPTAISSPDFTESHITTPLPPETGYHATVEGPKTEVSVSKVTPPTPRVSYDVKPDLSKPKGSQTDVETTKEGQVSANIPGSKPTVSTKLERGQVRPQFGQTVSGENKDNVAPTLSHPPPTDTGGKVPLKQTSTIPSTSPDPTSNILIDSVDTGITKSPSSSIVQKPGHVDREKTHKLPKITLPNIIAGKSEDTKTKTDTHTAHRPVQSTGTPETHINVLVTPGEVSPELEENLSKHSQPTLKPKFPEYSIPSLDKVSESPVSPTPTVTDQKRPAPVSHGLLPTPPRQNVYPVNVGPSTTLPSVKPAVPPPTITPVTKSVPATPLNVKPVGGASVAPETTNAPLRVTIPLAVEPLDVRRTEAPVTLPVQASFKPLDERKTGFVTGAERVVTPNVEKTRTSPSSPTKPQVSVQPVVPGPIQVSRPSQVPVTPTTQTKTAADRGRQGKELFVSEGPTRDEKRPEAPVTLPVQANLEPLGERKTGFVTGPERVVSSNVGKTPSSPSSPTKPQVSVQPVVPGPIQVSIPSQVRVTPTTQTKTATERGRQGKELFVSEGPTRDEKRPGVVTRPALRPTLGTSTQVPAAPTSRTETSAEVGRQGKELFANEVPTRDNKRPGVFTKPALRPSFGTSSTQQKLPTPSKPQTTLPVNQQGPVKTPVLQRPKGSADTKLPQAPTATPAPHTQYTSSAHTHTTPPTHALPGPPALSPKPGSPKKLPKLENTLLTGSVQPQRQGGAKTTTGDRRPSVTGQVSRPATGGTFDARSPVKPSGTQPAGAPRAPAAQKPSKASTVSQPGKAPTVTAGRQPSFAPKTTTDTKTGPKPQPAVSGGTSQSRTPSKPQTSGGASKSSQTPSPPKRVGIDPRFDVGGSFDSKTPRPQPALGGRVEKPTSGAGKPPQAGGRGSVKHSTSTLGGLLYRFNYTAGYHGHHEQGDRAGTKDGGYEFVGRDGLLRRIDYIANEFGYQPHLSLEKVRPEDTPREETEKEAGLKGYEFKWFNPE